MNSLELQELINDNFGKELSNLKVNVSVHPWGIGVTSRGEIIEYFSIEQGKPIKEIVSEIRGYVENLTFQRAHSILQSPTFNGHDNLTT